MAWEEALDVVGLSRQRINAFVIVVGVVALVVLGLLYRGADMVGAVACVAIGVVLAIMSLVVRQQRGRSWWLCLVHGTH
ncbi:MAG TPA: hypothetical protein VJ914_33120 [Pseudonocardiaceae bacterium]|nr:hypothetical protein [Pseudonocardiaceae bacterium]